MTRTVANPAYGRGVEKRDELHQQVMDAAEAHKTEVAELVASLRDGRISPTEARSQLRDIEAGRQRLLDSHRGIEASEEHLAEMEAQTADEVRDSTLRRMPAMRSALNAAERG